MPVVCYLCYSRSLARLITLAANALLMFSPIITFVLVALIASLNRSALSTEVAFTTTALLALVTYPSHMIMSAVPKIIGSFAAFERVQQYLLEPPRQDKRLVLNQAKEKSITPAICFEDVTIQTASSTPPLLSNINLIVEKGSIVICSGPVGSGKTTLIKSLLGEVPIARGTISVSSKRIAWCDQSPWLPNGTLKEAICGFDPEDLRWYKQIVRLCCLDEDLSSLADGEYTIVGSRGLNLSGGQRQRVVCFHLQSLLTSDIPKIGPLVRAVPNLLLIQSNSDSAPLETFSPVTHYENENTLLTKLQALARALYARCETVLLDDSFSALDGKTESLIVDNLFGPRGHFRRMGTTVILVTNSGEPENVSLEGHKSTYSMQLHIFIWQTYCLSLAMARRRLKERGTILHRIRSTS